MTVFKQIKLNFFYLSKKALSHTITVIAAIQILGFLCDFSKIYPEVSSFLNRLMISAVVFAIIWFVMFVMQCVSLFFKKRETVIDAGNFHHVYVEYGDLFKNIEGSRNVVIPANRCFDTLVDNDLISETTIHGMAIKKILDQGYLAENLNKALQEDLKNNRQVKPVCRLSRRDKRKGNLERYPVGTIAEFKTGKKDEITYFFLAMSAFNRDLHPETTDEEYSIAMQSLIKYCNVRSQRIPVYMPIIGTHGRSNKKSERELLEYMVNILRFNKHLINTDIHIVVYHEHKTTVSIYGL